MPETLIPTQIGRLVYLAHWIGAPEPLVVACPDRAAHPVAPTQGSINGVQKPMGSRSFELHSEATS